MSTFSSSGEELFQGQKWLPTVIHSQVIAPTYSGTITPTGYDVNTCVAFMLPYADGNISGWATATATSSGIVITPADGFTYKVNARLLVVRFK